LLRLAVVAQQLLMQQYAAVHNLQVHIAGAAEHNAARTSCQCEGHLLIECAKVNFTRCAALCACRRGLCSLQELR
jgi:hypothetical protein